MMKGEALEYARPENARPEGEHSIAIVCNQSEGSGRVLAKHERSKRI
jgi:hypothetical protein